MLQMIEIKPAYIQKGDIVTFKDSVYIDFKSSKWHDHFVSKISFALALETPTNNGNFKAKGMHHPGTMHLNAVKEVIKAYRRADKHPKKYEIA